MAEMSVRIDPNMKKGLSSFDNKPFPVIRPSGGDKGNRTPDLMTASHALSRAVFSMPPLRLRRTMYAPTVESQVDEILTRRVQIVNGRKKPTAP